MIPAAIAKSLALALGAEGLLSGAVGIWAVAKGIESAPGFLLLATGACFVSGGLLLATRKRGQHWSRRTALINAVAVWGVLALGGLVPFWSAGAELHLALFDSVSAVTTTGYWSSPGGNPADPAILLWRALLQWTGGLVTLLVAAILILPVGLGGANNPQPATSAGDNTIDPSIVQRIGATYAALTALCLVLLYATGTTALDSSLYALSAIATGGDPRGYPGAVAGSDTSLVVLALFMLAGALWLPHGRIRLRSILAALARSSETILLVALLVAGTGFAWLAVPSTSLINGFVFSASLVSTSGIGLDTRDVAITPLLILAVIGGSVAGAAGGLRLRRVWLLGSIIWNEFNRGFQPHEVRVLRHEGRPVDSATVSALFAFAVLWFTACACLAAVLSVTGLTAEDAVLGAVAALTNTGPGMATLVGADGPAGSLGTAAVMVGMLLGRLETIGLIAILAPSFWRT